MADLFASIGGEGFKSTGRHGRVASRNEKSPGRNGSDFRVWMTGLEPATSWSLKRRYLVIHLCFQTAEAVQNTLLVNADNF